MYPAFLLSQAEEHPALDGRQQLPDLCGESEGSLVQPQPFFLCKGLSARPQNGSEAIRFRKVRVVEPVTQRLIGRGSRYRFWLTVTAPLSTGPTCRPKRTEGKIQGRKSPTPASFCKNMPRRYERKSRVILCKSAYLCINNKFACLPGVLQVRCFQTVCFKFDASRRGRAIPAARWQDRHQTACVAPRRRQQVSKRGQSLNFKGC